MFADVLPGVPNPVDWLAEQASGVATGQMASGFRWLSERLFEAVGWLFSELFGLLDSSTGADPNAAWFTTGPYALMLRVAGGALLLSVMLGIGHAVWHHDGGAGVRLVVAELPKTIVKTAGLLAAVTIAIGFADALTHGFLAGFGSSAKVLSDRIGHLPAGVNLGAALLVAIVVAILVLMIGLTVLVELLVRTGFIYVLVALAPLALATDVWEPLRGAGQRTGRTLAGVILAKPMVALCFAIGGSLLANTAQPTQATVPAVAEPGPAVTAATTGTLPSQDATELIGGMLVGLATLALAAFAPFVLLRLVPFGDATATSGAADAVKGAARAAGSGGAGRSGGGPSTGGGDQGGSGSGDASGGGGANGGSSGGGDGGGAAAGAKASKTSTGSGSSSGSSGGAGGAGAAGEAGGAGQAAGAAAAGAAVVA